ncbi:MAG TPA: DEAD/DEAH box helicase, partial [Solirubrobacteraceae bacterium]
LHKQAAEAARSHIVVATPGRLEDLLQRRSLSIDAVRILVLDEADRMLDMGFRPAVDRIVARTPRARQTLFFSATLDGVAGRVASAYTTKAVLREHGSTRRRSPSEIEHRFVEVSDDNRVDTLVAALSGERELALVFVRTKRGADRLVKRLGAQGVDAAAIHGNKSQHQREQALAHFESGRVDTLVATDVAARGLDVQGISHVINFDLPADHDTYVHRIGRTGRAGRQGTAITLVGGPDRADVALLAGELGIEHGLSGATERTRRRPEPSARPANHAQRRSRRRHQAAKSA